MPTLDLWSIHMKTPVIVSDLPNMILGGAEAVASATASSLKEPIKSADSQGIPTTSVISGFCTKVTIAASNAL